MAASSGARHTRAAVRARCPTTNQIQGLRQGTHSMKPQTEKRSEPVMKFFTPELFIKFNSPDDVVADRADEDWEAAIREYRSHLGCVISLRSANTRAGRQIVGWWRRPQARRERSSPGLTHHFSLGFLGLSWKIQDIHMIV